MHDQWLFWWPYTLRGDAEHGAVDYYISGPSNSLRIIGLDRPHTYHEACDD